MGRPLQGGGLLAAQDALFAAGAVFIMPRLPVGKLVVSLQCVAFWRRSVFSLLGVLAITLILFMTVAVTARFLLGR